MNVEAKSKKTDRFLRGWILKQEVKEVKQRLLANRLPGKRVKQETQEKDVKKTISCCECKLEHVIPSLKDKQRLANEVREALQGNNTGDFSDFDNLGNNHKLSLLLQQVAYFEHVDGLWQVKSMQEHVLNSIIEDMWLSQRSL